MVIMDIVNKNPFIAAGLTLVAFLLPLSLMAEDIEDEEDTGEDAPVIVIEESDEKLGSYFTKHFGGDLIASEAGLGDEDNSRTNVQLRLRYQEEWQRGLVVAEYIGYNSQVELTLARGENSDETLTQSFDVTDSEWREVYVKLSPTEYWDLAVGRQAITIGQFDIFSPVDFILPVDFTNTRLTYSKADYRLPQLALRNDFAMGNWLLEAVYFPSLTSDALLEVARSVPEEYFDPLLGSPCSNYAAYEDGDCGENVPVPQNIPADESQYLLRLIYSSPSIVYGWTVYEGYNIFLFGSGVARLREGNVGDEKWFYRELLPTIERRRAYGFELSVPINRFNMKFEVLAEPATFPLRFEAITESEMTQAQRDYRDFIQENNNNLNVAVDQYIAAWGFDYYGDKNFFNVYLVFFDYFGERADRIISIEEKAFPEEDGSPFGNVLPAFNIGREFGVREQHTIGGIAGFLSFAFGASFYYANDFYDSFNYGASLEAFQYISNFVYASQARSEDEEDAPAGSDRELEPAGLTVGVRVGFEYSF